MDDKDQSVEKALDDIFNGDFIEIDNKIDNKDSESDTNLKIIKENDDFESEIKSNNDETVMTHTMLNIPLIEDSNTINMEETKDIKEDANIDIIKDEAEEISNKTDAKINNNQNYLGGNNINLNNLQNVKKLKKINIINESKKQSNDNSNKKSFIIIFITIVISMILIVLLVNYLNNKQRVVNCSYVAEDTGYKITDEYKIKYKKNQIIYVQGIYNYQAKTDEFKNQINYIREEKLPVIINSNGMNGFTYNYESSEDYFKVNSYLDFKLFDYKIIDKVNYDLAPISYVKISSKTTFDSFTKDLKNNGYKCTNSK